MAKLLPAAGDYRVLLDGKEIGRALGLYGVVFAKSLARQFYVHLARLDGAESLAGKTLVVVQRERDADGEISQTAWSFTTAGLATATDDSVIERCPRHDLPVDPVVGGCSLCLHEIGA